MLKMAKAKADDVLSSGGQLRVMAVAKRLLSSLRSVTMTLCGKYPQIAEKH